MSELRCERTPDWWSICDDDSEIAKMEFYEGAGEAGELLAYAFNSYARHCADPVKAADDDLLGQALEVLREIESNEFNCKYTNEDMRDLARAILDKAKRKLK